MEMYRILPEQQWSSLSLLLFSTVVGSLVWTGLKCCFANRLDAFPTTLKLEKELKARWEGEFSGREDWGGEVNCQLVYLSFMMSPKNQQKLALHWTGIVCVREGLVWCTLCVCCVQCDALCVWCTMCDVLCVCVVYSVMHCVWCTMCDVLCVCRPDITFAVDWALKNNYLDQSITMYVCDVQCVMYCLCVWCLSLTIQTP